jgi:hypothetical protein
MEVTLLSASNSGCKCFGCSSRAHIYDYERRDLLRSTYRFSLQGLHYGLHPDKHVVQASAMAAPKHLPVTLRNMRELGVQIARLGMAAILLLTATILLLTAMDISIAAPSPTQLEQQVPPGEPIDLGAATSMPLGRQTTTFSNCRTESPPA